MKKNYKEIIDHKNGIHTLEFKIGDVKEFFKAIDKEKNENTIGTAFYSLCSFIEKYSKDISNLNDEQFLKEYYFLYSSIEHKRDYNLRDIFKYIISLINKIEELEKDKI